jgi:peptide/nickel transport system substrate-binding protein
LTAADVAFTFDYFKAHRESVTWSWPLDKIAGAEVVDDQTVTLTLTEPLASAHEVLIGSLPIIPQHIWEGIDDPLKETGENAVIGSGPFTLTAYNKEEGRYIYVANDDYFNGKPNVGSLVFIKVENEALALQTDTTDYASFSGKAIEAAKEFQDDPDYNIIEGPGYWVLQLIFNTSQAPFDNLQLRQAVAHAVNREQIVEQITHDGAIVASLGILSPDTDWFNPDLPTYEQDVDTAKQLIEEAGEATEIPALTLITTADYVREAELIKADLAVVGLDVTIQSGDRGTVDGLLREGSFDLAINGHGGLANPSILESPTWPSTIYQNETYNQLYQEQARTVDDDARREMVWDLQEIVATDLPVLTLWHPKMWTVYDPAKLDTWFYTDAGIGFGIPIAMNKLSFIE